MRDRIVVGVRENSLRKKLLQTRDLTLRNCIDVLPYDKSTAEKYVANRRYTRSSLEERWKERQS